MEINYESRLYFISLKIATCLAETCSNSLYL